MFDYLQQFNNLPKDLRDKVSSPEAMAALAILEKKYQVELAVLVMKVMVKSLSLKSLPASLMEEFGMEQVMATKLAEEMTETIFRRAGEYLNLAPIQPIPAAPDKLELIIKEAGVILPSADLLSRFKLIVSTYLKGVRSKIATRDALAKDINLGGLKLSEPEIDRIFRACDGQAQNSPEQKINLTPPISGLDKIIASDAAKNTSAEYDFKKALAAGQIHKPAIKLEAPEKPAAISAPQEIKAIEAPDAEKMLAAPEKIVAPEVAIKKSVEVKPLVAPAPLSKERLVAPSQDQKTALSVGQTTGAPKPSLEKPVVAEKPPVKTSAPLIEKPPASIFSTWFKKEAKVKNIEPEKKPLEKPAQKLAAEQTIAAPKNIEKEAPAPRPAMVAAARPASHLKETPSKPVMHDVKPATRVMGPIEELQFLDLINFRRLGRNSEEISAKIFNKIKLLEADGYERMIAGVRAWRQSPVNLLYLKMMKEAISKGKTIKDFAASVEKDKDNYLSLEEIEGIIAMNSKLVF